MSTQLDDFIASIPFDQLAGQLGVSESEAKTAVEQAAPALLAGMQANAADPAGAASLEAAVGQHDPSLLDALDLGGVDTDDGTKIVRHIFGDNEGQVVNQLSGAKGLSSGTLITLLPILAPLVMAFLSKAMKGGGGKAQASTPAASGGTAASSPAGGSGARGFPSPSNPTSSARPADTGAGDADQGSGGGLGDVLGGGGLGDILGGLLGGGSGGGGGGLGDILGGLLGGGTK